MEIGELKNNYRNRIKKGFRDENRINGYAYILTPALIGDE